MGGLEWTRLEDTEGGDLAVKRGSIEGIKSNSQISKVRSWRDISIPTNVGMGPYCKEICREKVEGNDVYVNDSADIQVPIFSRFGNPALVIK